MTKLTLPRRGDLAAVVEPVKMRFFLHSSGVASELAEGNVHLRVTMTDTGRPYHNQCTGEALQTVQCHAADEDITLFGGCFCPFVQRAWVAFDYLGIQYKVRRVSLIPFPNGLIRSHVVLYVQAISYVT